MLLRSTVIAVGVVVRYPHAVVVVSARDVVDESRDVQQASENRELGIMEAVRDISVEQPLRWRWTIGRDTTRIGRRVHRHGAINNRRVHEARRRQFLLTQIVLGSNRSRPTNLKGLIVIRRRRPPDFCFERPAVEVCAVLFNRQRNPRPCNQATARLTRFRGGEIPCNEPGFGEMGR
jgi:hypothetical protein